MYKWFQNLNENKSKLFHFRGSFGRSYDKECLKYELSSGAACRFQFTIKPYQSASLSIGLIFFSIHLTFPFFSFKRWIKENLTSGFYFYNWALVWSWMEDPMGGRSSETPWYKHFYFHIDDFFLGKKEVLKDDRLYAENVKFKLGVKEFTMDRIDWMRRRSFRRYIPYVLFHREWYSVEMKIENPPLHSGKGENSWDCGDDGTYELYAPWEGTKPTWQNKSICTKEAVEYYVEGVLKDTRRYGGSKSERGISKSDIFEYIGLESVRNSEIAMGAPNTLTPKL